MPARALPRPVLIAGVTGSLAALLTACSSSGGGASDPTGGSGTTAAADPRVANVTITAAGGCAPDKTSFPAGGITVKINNKDANAVSEVEILDGVRILGEKEGVVAGLNGEFAVTVDAGEYTLYCPGATPEKTTLTVTGEAAQGDEDIAALLKDGTTAYAAYVEDQTGYLVEATEKLNTALKGSDLKAAQDAYKVARPFYEKIEPVAESFTVGEENLDADIDARDGDVPAGEWRGFHKIEKGLFEDNSLTGLVPLGDELVTNVKKLQTLTTGLTYQPTELANGAQELLDEVANGKITGEEERYSHIDILDMNFNVEGAEQAFGQLVPALQKIDKTLADTVLARFTDLKTLIAKYKTDSDASGFKLYNELSDADKKDLAAAVKAVVEPLSKVASKVANA